MRHRTRRNHGRAAALALAFAWALAAPADRVAARETPRALARAGLDLARAAAEAWSPGAQLVYVENDEPLDAGSAARWGYLFYSPRLRKVRAYSVGDGKIETAENLDLKLDAPPVDARWIDSDAALAAADKAAGRAYRADHGGMPRTMLLMRGAFDDDVPDATTWLVVYDSPQEPTLFVVVEATGGAVRKTWRG